MTSPIRSDARSSAWSWLGDNAAREQAANQVAPGDLASSALGSRYWIEGAVTRPVGCISHRATRRVDDRPVSIVIPQSPNLHKFANAMLFVQTARAARRVHHPYVLRTIEAGLLDDGRPFVIIERLPTESLSTWLARHRRTSWTHTQAIAMRLCSAVEAARERGLAPRNLDLEGCLRVRDGVDVSDVRLGELFVPYASRLPATDAPAIAMIIHELMGGQANRASGPVGNLLIRALGSNGFADVRELSTAIAAISQGGVYESQGANHVGVAGEFTYDDQEDERQALAQPFPRFLDRANAKTVP